MGQKILFIFVLAGLSMGPYLVATPNAGAQNAGSRAPTSGAPESYGATTTGATTGAAPTGRSSGAAAGGAPQTNPARTSPTGTTAAGTSAARAARPRAAAAPGGGNTFSNSYVSFNLPPQWKCEREGTEYVCNHPQPAIKKQAVIIVTAKQVGPTDNLAAYEGHLKQTQPMGPQKPSKILHTKRGPINQHEWVDGLQLDSEVTGFYTRYLATIKGGLAILVTFSAGREHYSQFAPHFNRAVASLRVLAMGLKNTDVARRQGGSLLGTGLDLSGLGDDDEASSGESGGGGLFSDPTSWLGLLLVVGAVAFVLWRRKKRA